MTTAPPTCSWCGQLPRNCVCEDADLHIPLPPGEPSDSEIAAERFGGGEDGRVWPESAARRALRVRK